MVHLITPNEIAFTAHIDEDDLRQRLIEEVLGQIGGIDGAGLRRTRVLPLPFPLWQRLVLAPLFCVGLLAFVLMIGLPDGVIEAVLK